ncbi:MAG: tetratricopeptide repeat-containing sensor histidine kinase, partial [Emticicia sp.]|uniref:tetratricopeptide repeat-containing sensor histidine kinase n=1 Tax=Emticicia sp. TaxID=1930953 RepID=UPI003BA5C327
TIGQLPEAIKTYYQNAYLSGLLNQGHFDGQRGNFKKEIETYYEIIKNGDIKKNAKAIAYTHFSLSTAFGKEQEYDKSLENLSKGLKIALQINDKNLTGLIYGNLSVIYKRLGNIPKSLDYSFKNLAIMREINNPNYVASSLNRIGQLYKEKKEYKNAIDYFDQAIIESKKLMDTESLAAIYFNLHEIYAIQKNEVAAQKNLLLSYQYAKKGKHIEYIEEIGPKVYKIFKKTGDYKNALEVIEQTLSAKDSLNKEENKNAILKAEFKYQNELKEAQIKTLAQKNKIAQLESQRKNALIYSILGGILALAAVAYFSFTRFKSRKENELLQTKLEEAERRVEIEQKATESELKALKSQMNPHFMFNALNSIQEQFMFGDKKLANEQMGNFTYLTRQILTISGKKRITLATEVEVLTKYLELEKMRFNDGFQYEITLSDVIDEDYHQIPPMLIQPFVENSVKHGLMHKQGSKNLFINFDLDATEENILCTVEDNGIGREKSSEIKAKRIQQHESFSTAATEERLRLLSHQFNSTDLVRYQDLKDSDGNPTGTKVIIKIPIG